MVLIQIKFDFQLKKDKYYENASDNRTTLAAISFDCYDSVS